MVITLTQPKEVIVTPEKKITLSTLTIERMVDLPNEKIVRVFIREIPEALVLWEGDAYDTIGQWTDANVKARIKELI